MPLEFWARFDSNTANNAALNLTNEPAVQIGFAPAGSSGDVLLNYNGGSFDPDTEILIDGVAYNFVFESTSTLPTLNRDGAQQVPDQFEGATTFLIIVLDYPTAGATTRLAFLPEETATEAEMNDFGTGAVSLLNIDTTTPGEICFAEGTCLATPQGEVAVENLRVGDLLVTTTGEAKPILWISASRHQWPGSNPKGLPVQIAAGALGPHRPTRDLVVSPQHKILLTDPLTGQDVLAPAKGLVGLRGVRVMSGKRDVSYYHVLLDEHAVVFSEGLASESFYPGPTALRLLRHWQREEIFALFPELATGCAAWPKAYPTLTKSEAVDLAKSLKRPAMRAAA